jgi:hypothetical protein
MIILGKCREVGDRGVEVILVAIDEHKFTFVDDRKDTCVDVFSNKSTICISLNPLIFQLHCFSMQSMQTGLITQVSLGPLSHSMLYQHLL